MSEYTKGRVESRDGTTIGYRRMGAGPAVIVVHGGMQAAQHFMGLAGALAEEFEVFVPDRRGRGTSGPHGEQYCAAREVEDMQALVAESGASRIFGLSSGALVSLRTALATPGLTRVALYEPPLSIGGSVPAGWVPRLDRELAAGRVGAAMMTALKGLDVDPVMGKVPRFLLDPFIGLMTRSQKTEPGDVPELDLVPTIRYDMRMIRELNDTAAEYSALGAEVLLLGGTRGPAYLRDALGELERVLPNRRRVTLRGLSHSGPDDGGDPPRVAAELRPFFR